MKKRILILMLVIASIFVACDKKSGAFLEFTKGKVFIDSLTFPYPSSLTFSSDGNSLALFHGGPESTYNGIYLYDKSYGDMGIYEMTKSHDNSIYYIPLMIKNGELYRMKEFHNLDEKDDIDWAKGTQWFKKQ